MTTTTAIPGKKLVPHPSTAAPKAIVFSLLEVNYGVLSLFNLWQLVIKGYIYLFDTSD